MGCKPPGLSVEFADRHTSGGYYHAHIFFAGSPENLEKDDDSLTVPGLGFAKKFHCLFYYLPSCVHLKISHIDKKQQMAYYNFVEINKYQQNTTRMV
jgi:hypothetical protein